MKEREMEYLKGCLMQRREEVKDRIDSNKDLLGNTNIKDDLGELSSYDNHPGDSGSELYEMEKGLALKVHNGEELKDIEEALERIGKNKYGICDFCGNEIEFERLIAMPTAKLCIHCQENKAIDPRELDNDRPIEEEVLMYPFGRTFTDGEDSVVYDGEDTWQDVARYGSSSGPQDISVNRLIDYKNLYYDSDEDD